MTQNAFPPALKHGPLRELWRDVHFVSGELKMAGPPVAFSRNMTVIRDGESLTLVNALRLDDAGLAALDKLGEVKHVIRIAGFHGRDDPFYKAHYGATVWAIEGQVWAKGFDAAKPNPKTYFDADDTITEDTELPIEGARAVCIDAKTPEGLILLERHGGTLISGDALQNWGRTDEHFNLLGKVSMKLMGFIKPHAVGPGWLKEGQPDIAKVKSLLDLEFDNLLPAHGEPVIGDAKAKYRPAIDRLRG